MEKLIPILNDILSQFSSAKFSSLQNYKKLKWLKDQNCYISSCSNTPTECCIKWGYENICWTFTLL